jgi:hypothetical protein
MTREKKKENQLKQEDTRKHKINEVENIRRATCAPPTPPEY